MAKELPYFKFYIGEWSNGDITLEDYETQGVFVNICAYYWFKECQLTLSALNKKFRSHEHIITSLINLNIIKQTGDNVSISFLDEQFSSKEVQKAVNRNNGKLGGRPIGKKTEIKPNGLILDNRNESETKAKDNRNITNIEKSKEDKNISKDISVGLPASTTTKVASFDERCVGFINKFNGIRKSKYQATEKVKKALKLRLKTYTPVQIIEALQSAIKDPKHIEDDFLYLTPEFILRAEIIERYLNVTPKQQKQNYSPDHSRVLN